MLRKILVTFLFCISIQSNVFATEYISEGYGPTEKAAIHDAFRNAVENTIGINIDSKTYTNNNKIIHDQILTNSEGYIRDYSIISKRNSDNNTYVKLKVDIDTSPDSALMTRLQKLKAIKIGLSDPRIGIIILDKNSYSKENDASTENAIIDSLHNSGFSHIINLSQLNSETVNKYRMAGMNDDYQMISFLGTQQQVDYIIIGTVSSKKVELNMHTQIPVESYRSIIDIKTIKTDTAEVMQSGQYDSSAIDVAAENAKSQAKFKAGRIAGNAIGSKLINIASSNLKNYTLYIHNIKNNNEINRIETFLNNTIGIQDVYIRNFSSGIAIIDISFNGDSHELASYINNSEECKLTINQITNGSIDASL